MFFFFVYWNEIVAHNKLGGLFLFMREIKMCCKGITNFKIAQNKTLYRLTFSVIPEEEKWFFYKFLFLVFWFRQRVEFFYDREVRNSRLTLGLENTCVKYCGKRTEFNLGHTNMIPWGGGVPKVNRSARQKTKSVIFTNGQFSGHLI